MRKHNDAETSFSNTALQEQRKAGWKGLLGGLGSILLLETELLPCPG